MFWYAISAADNHIKDLSDLADIIINFDEESRVILEATGAYHLPVLSYLKQKGIFVAVINPLMMKKYSSLTLRKGKAKKVAKIAGLNKFLRIYYARVKEVYSKV